MKIRHADSAQDATGCAAIYAPFVEETAVSLEVRVPTAADLAASHRQGIGRALYSCLLDLLYRQGLWIACAGIGLPNDASVSLHESLGFLPVGVYRNIGYKLGRWWDVGWWQLSLRQPGEEHPPEPGPPVRLECKQSRAKPTYSASSDLAPS
jgi:phosphinothricin acetyltransferase